MRFFLTTYLISTLLILSCKVNRSTSYYSGDDHKDSIIRAIDAKYKNLEKVKITKGKRFLGSDSIVYYSVNKATNQLHEVGFTELKTDSRTTYDLVNGELMKVGYRPNNRERSAWAVYYYDNGNFVFKRERNTNSPDPQKFLDDVQFFKRALGVQ